MAFRALNSGKMLPRYRSTLKLEEAFHPVYSRDGPVG